MKQLMIGIHYKEKKDLIRKSHSKGRKWSMAL
jgi:hypothetical protein